MRLSENQVRQICQKVLQTLRAKQLIHLIKNETEVLARMEQIFITDLKVEDAINREAEKLVEQYAAKAGMSIDREKLFQMIKKQIIKDRNLVI